MGDNFIIMSNNFLNVKVNKMLLVIAPRFAIVDSIWVYATS